MQCQTPRAGKSGVFRKCCVTGWVIGTHPVCPSGPVFDGYRREVSCVVMLRGKGTRRIPLTLGKNKRHRISTVASAWGRDGVLVYGVYSSALSSSLTASLPPALTTLPLWSTVEVWPARALLMLPVAVHVPVAGL
jgi:hypothetical protein